MLSVKQPGTSPDHISTKQIQKPTPIIVRLFFHNSKTNR
jgi:hypothetical protein